MEPSASRPEIRFLEADFAQVYLGENVAGPQAERWFHAAGCKRWFEVTRDTRTNRVDRP